MTLTVGVAQLSVAVTNAWMLASVGKVSGLQPRSLPVGALVMTGGVVSCTAMVWTKFVALPQLSVADQVFVMVKLQSVPFVTELKLTCTLPSQLSLAVTTAGAGMFPLHS